MRLRKIMNQVVIQSMNIGLTDKDRILFYCNSDIIYEKYISISMPVVIIPNITKKSMTLFLSYPKAIDNDNEKNTPIIAIIQNIF